MPVRGNYFIAVCDILGFSELVEHRSLDSVVDEALGWFRRALNHSIHGGDFPVSLPKVQELGSSAHVGVAWFSDTVLLYTKQDTDEAVADVLTTVASLLFETIVQGVTRVRAGVSYGDAFIDHDNSLYVGKPIIEAYWLEKQQQWAGGALTSSACERIPQTGHSGEVARWFLTRWDVPMKGQEPMSTLAVNWNRGVHAPQWRLRWSATSALPLEPRSREEQSVHDKFVNTKQFHEAHCHDCRSSEA